MCNQAVLRLQACRNNFVSRIMINSQNANPHRGVESRKTLPFMFWEKQRMWFRAASLGQTSSQTSALTSPAPADIVYLALIIHCLILKRVNFMTSSVSLSETQTSNNSPNACPHTTFLLPWQRPASQLTIYSTRYEPECESCLCKYRWNERCGWRSEGEGGTGWI